ncbi:hypothetical protein BJ165DRAFT_1402829 [Panaeolus papilionaceus]|nr:hypothetical protein BJ165DRAFT_1402829 [Panaeolus papilionaceus]
MTLYAHSCCSPSTPRSHPLTTPAAPPQAIDESRESRRVLRGFYTVLFIAALWIWVLITLMWLVASVHLGTSIRRLLRMCVLEIEVGKKPPGRTIDATKWDNMAHILLTTVMMVLGDILVIYRTYIVWNRSIRIVALPVIVHTAYMVVNAMALYAFSHPDRIPRKTAFAWYKGIFPLVFAQNVMTTALLTYKTHSAHHVSLKNGATNATPGVMRFGSLSRILIETAMLYTIDLLLMIVLGALTHPATAIAAGLHVPMLGIVFVLLSVRVYFSGTPTNHNWSTPSKVPNVLRNSTLEDGTAVPRLASTGAHRPITALRLDGDIDIDILTLRRHDLDDSNTPNSISQRGSQEWL